MSDERKTDVEALIKKLDESIKRQKLAQFSLRSLLVGVLLFAVVFSAVENFRLRRMNASLEQQKAAAEKDRADALRRQAAVQADLRLMSQAFSASETARRKEAAHQGDGPSQ